eukprot:m.59859 g.59859  ORF g.59859 m.59859 type:complete len:396 (-) comp49283_c0_seq1:113-1300(-)
MTFQRLSLGLQLGLDAFVVVSLAVALRKMVDDGKRKVRQHHGHENSKSDRHPARLGLLSVIAHELLARLDLLVVDELVQVLADNRDIKSLLHDDLDGALTHEHNHEEHLDVHLDDCLANRRCKEERLEGNKEMSASDASQIKERVWNRCTCKNAPKPRLLHHHMHKFLEFACEVGWLRVDSVVEFLEVLVIRRFSRQTCSTSHEVRRELTNGCPKTPHECWPAHTRDHTGNRHRIEINGSLKALDRLPRGSVGRVERLLELRGVADVCSLSHVCNVRTQVEEEGVKTGAEADRGKNTKHNPVCGLVEGQLEPMRKLLLFTLELDIEGKYANDKSHNSDGEHSLTQPCEERNGEIDELASEVDERDNGLLEESHRGAFLSVLAAQLLQSALICSDP